MFVVVICEGSWIVVAAGKPQLARDLVSVGIPRPNDGFRPRDNRDLGASRAIVQGPTPDSFCSAGALCWLSGQDSAEPAVRERPLWPGL